MIMATAKAGNRKRAKEVEVLRSEKKKKKREEDEEEEDFDPDMSNDIKSLLSAIHQIKEKAQKDGLKKSEQTISSVSSEIKSVLDDARAKIEKERHNFVKALSKSSKECESSLKNEYAKFQAVFEKLSKEKSTHMQTFKDIFSQFEEEKEKLFVRYEQQRKKEKTMLAELGKTCADKISSAENSLKKKKQDDKCFNMLRKSLGSLMDCGSDEDFPSDD